jgi:hypothetical protein
MWGSNGLNSDRLKQGLKKYGRTGVYTYLALSTMVTTGADAGVLAWSGIRPPQQQPRPRHPRIAHHPAGFYIAIERNVDVKKIMGIKGGAAVLADLTRPAQRSGRQPNALCTLACCCCPTDCRSRARRPARHHEQAVAGARLPHSAGSSVQQGMHTTEAAGGRSPHALCVQVGLHAARGTPHMQQAGHTAGAACTPDEMLSSQRRPAPSFGTSACRWQPSATKRGNEERHPPPWLPAG